MGSPAAAALAIGSKFILRVRGKHLFNPANFGVGAALLVLPGTWISPGQWGSDVALAGWLVDAWRDGRERRAARGYQLLFLTFYLVRWLHGSHGSASVGRSGPTSSVAERCCCSRSS